MRSLVDACRKSAPQRAQWLETAIPEVLAELTLPGRHGQAHADFHPIERAVQQALERRTVRVRVFPNNASLLRLVTAVLVDIDDTWLASTQPSINCNNADAREGHQRTSRHRVASSRLIALPWTRCARRIFATVSTTSSLNSAPDDLGSTVAPYAKGIPIGRRSPLRRGPLSTPSHPPPTYDHRSRRPAHLADLPLTLADGGADASLGSTAPRQQTASDLGLRWRAFGYGRSLLSGRSAHVRRACERARHAVRDGAPRVGPQRPCAIGPAAAVPDGCRTAAR